MSDEYRELQNKYHQTRIMLEEEQKRRTELEIQVKSLTTQRDEAIHQLRKYKHAFEIIDIAYKFLEVDDD